MVSQERSRSLTPSGWCTTCWRRSCPCHALEFIECSCASRSGRFTAAAAINLQDKLRIGRLRCRWYPHVPYGTSPSRCGVSSDIRGLLKCRCRSCRRNCLTVFPVSNRRKKLPVVSSQPQVLVCICCGPFICMLLYTRHTPVSLTA